MLDKERLLTKKFKEWKGSRDDGLLERRKLRRRRARAFDFDCDVQYRHSTLQRQINGFQESRGLSSARPDIDQTVETRLRHLIDAPTMASHALKQVCYRIHPSRKQ